MNIGFFDSGFGGLTILRAAITALPQYNFAYLGDTARSPYGPRSTAEVRQFTAQAIQFLFDQNCSLVIVACNTATCQALRWYQQTQLPPGKKVLGVIVPAIEAVVEHHAQARIGVMATQGTVLSGAFAREITKFCPSATVVQQACPALVPLIEAGKIHTPEFITAVRRYVAPLKTAGVSAVILGCTHYGLAKQVIQAELGQGIVIIDEAPVVAVKLADYLRRHTELPLATKGERHFYTTGPSFNTHAGQFFGEPVHAALVKIGETPLQ